MTENPSSATSADCLICDDHPMVAQALAMTVGLRLQHLRIHLATDFPTAWAMAAACRPVLCLADLVMPGATPRDGITGLMAAAPQTRLIVVTGSDDDALMVDLLATGISGFVAKTASPAVIGAAIDLVMAGGRYLPPRLAQIGGAAVPPPWRGAAVPTLTPAADPLRAALPPLTARQVDVLRLLARGFPNKDIARTLGVAPATVKTHVAQVMLALGAANRTDAAVKARELGLL
jgi:DNA-binding NarL/FixJ family response regulator